MKASMKAGDKVRVGALRMLMAAITTKQVEGAVARELSDDEVRRVAAQEVKKRTESIVAFEAAGRTELVEKERAERDVLTPYAPPQVDESAVDALVDEAIAATGATSVNEIGRVMGAVMAKAKALGQVDGNVVQAKVRARLEG
ncbi:MAG: GatB/YqeY domain-containing protein [Actinobacteria bacterium]|nr:GatB/YqeY domain-containing protein [Actinomycetota bacterium]